MKAENLSRDELIKRIENGLNSIGSRVADIKEAGYRLGKDAVYRFEKLVENIPEDLNSMSDKELRNTYRDLLYINDLKTSTLEGAEQASVMYKDIEDMLGKLSEPMRKRIWDLYNNLYSENKNIGSALYKYDVLREIVTEVYKSRSKKSTLEELEESMRNVIDLISGGRDVNIHEELQKERHRKIIDNTELDYRTRLDIFGF